ncbi:MAG TPA: RluA family pseudouridine synthase [Chlamydiales bacterium]|nr:RluA family pseudouridine synthase [Chlamydiales bacterium]
MDTDTLVVSSQEAGERLDKLLALHYDSYSRTYFQHLLDVGCVLLNGKPVKKRICPSEGDEIEVCFQAIPGPSLEPQEIPLNILYEDEHILAINKPPGMVVHPAPGNWSGTFVNALLYHCKNMETNDDPVRPGIVHRLDKDTSGLLIAAKTLQAHQTLIEAFSQRKIEKTYLAVVFGKPENAIIDAPIGRHPTKRKEMAVIEKGREAITHVETMGYNEQISLVRLKPKTGRTHQIRVHLKHIGCPILGDSIYGSEKSLIQPERLLLHAYQLQFQHPITKAPLHLSAPIPDDFKKWIQKVSC